MAQDTNGYMSFPDIDKALGTKRGVAFYRYQSAMKKILKYLTLHPDLYEEFKYDRENTSRT